MSAEVSRRSSRPLLVAAAVLALETLVSIGFAALQLVALGPVVAAGIITAAVIIGYAAALAVLALGVARGRRWSRAPAIATQLIHLPVAWGLRGDPTGPIALAMGATSAIVVVCLLLPSSTAIFVPEAARRPPG